jgi:putative nucleotidyltransferase with HDIG domain
MKEEQMDLLTSINKTAESNNKTQKIVETIRKQIRLFNLIVVATVYCLLFLVVKFLYHVLNYMPVPSLVAIICMITLLVVSGMYAVNAASRKAVEKIEDYISMTDALLSTTKSMRETIHTDLLLDNVLNSSMNITGAEAGSIFLAEADNLVFKAARGNESHKLKGFMVSRTAGIVGCALSSGSVIRVDDASADERFNPRVDLHAGCETRSLLCAPMVLDSTPLGVLELVNKRGGAFSEEDESIISYFADEAATAISRARFFEDQKNYEIYMTDFLITVMDNYLDQKVGHARRVAKYSLLMADGLTMAEDGRKRLYRACLLHDIGFLRMKPDVTASQSEFSSHSEFGYELLRQINFYADIARIVLHHHERFDGKGYPAGLPGENIPLESRIIAIAEAFDTMASGHSYKSYDNFPEAKMLPAERFRHAIRELVSGAGTQFDPKLVDIFVSTIDEGQTAD